MPQCWYRAVSTTSDGAIIEIFRTANKEDGVHLDAVAESFWGRDRQRAFFYVRVFKPFASSYHNTSLSQCYRCNEQEQRRAYEERITEIEHGSFSPLVFTTSGGMGTTATVVYKRLTSLIADTSYNRTVHWLGCRLNFSLLRSAIMCLQGSCSTVNHPAIQSITGDNIDLTCSEGQVPE